MQREISHSASSVRTMTQPLRPAACSLRRSPTWAMPVTLSSTRSILRARDCTKRGYRKINCLPAQGYIQYGGFSEPAITTRT